MLSAGGFKLSETPYRRKALRVAGVFFIITAAIGALYPQTGDAPAHIIKGMYIVEHLSFPYLEYEINIAGPYVYPPVFPVLVGVAGVLTGIHSLVPAVMGAVSVWLTYELVRYWWDEQGAFLSALALALNPFFILWSVRVYVGTTITAGFLLAFLLYFRYLDRKRRRDLYLSFAIGGGLMLVKTYGPATVCIMTLHYLITHRDRLTTAVRNIFVPGIVAVVASTPWLVRNFLRAGSVLPKVTRGVYQSGSESTSPGVFLFVPSPVEGVQFLTVGLGLNPKNFVTGPLKDVIGAGIFIWLALPLILAAVVFAGLYYRRDNIFVWVWGAFFLLIYEVQRVLSGVATQFRFRHFVTFVPVMGFLAVTAYRNSSLRWKKPLTVGIVLLLLAQMVAVNSAFIVHKNAKYQDITDWIETNVEEEEVIYSPDYASLAYRTSTDYKFIYRSRKEGYVNPNENFTDEIQKAEWVIVTEVQNRSAEIALGVQTGVLVPTATIDSRIVTPWGNPNGSRKLVDVFGQRWHVYAVKDSPNGTK